jgi:RNA recognition motif-containing protein
MQGNKLYIGNLSYSVTDKQLEELLSSYGKVQSATVIGNKGFGFVEMSGNAEAEKAKEALDGTDFEGRNLKVDEAHPKRSSNARTDRRY